MSLELLKKSLMDAPIVKKGEYHYVVHPIMDGIPEIKPELLEEVVSEMHKRIERVRPIDKIVTMEAMGIPLATALSQKMNIPFVIIRKRTYGLQGEVAVDQKTGYSKSKLYINDLKHDDKIVIVDDVLSTGGTLKAVLSALKTIGVDVKGVFIAVNKGTAADSLINDFNVNLDIIVSIEIINGNVLIK